MSKLKKDEEKILYHIYKRYTTDYKPFKISDLISELIDEYNRDNIIVIIHSFVSQGFIVVKIKGITHPTLVNILEILKTKPDMVEIFERTNDLELCAPNVEKINEIKKLLRYRIGIDWLRKKFIQILQFIWNNLVIIIISVIVSISSYIITK